MNQSFSLLPYMPLDPAWIEQAAAFHHADPRMLKAAVKLLFAAWRGSPAASIPSSHSYIAETTGLAPELVAERYVSLTDGFELRDDGRLHHGGLATICAKMTEGYGAEIASYTTSLAMVAQDPEQFSLMSMEAGRAGAKVRGKHLLPKGFGYEAHPELRAWCIENGYPAPNQQRYIMEKFIDFAVGRGDKQKDWVATFRTYARNEITGYNRLPPQAIWPEGHPSAATGALRPQAGTAHGRPNPFANLSRQVRGNPAKGEQAIDHNNSVMAAARESMRATPKG